MREETPTETDLLCCQQHMEKLTSNYEKTETVFSDITKKGGLYKKDSHKHN